MQLHQVILNETTQFAFELMFPSSEMEEKYARDGESHKF